MPHRLKQRQAKIQAKRKTTPWREFLMEIGSRMPLTIYNHHNLITSYAPTERAKNLHSPSIFQKNYVNYQSTSTFSAKNSFENFSRFFAQIPKISLVQYKKNENCDFAYNLYGGKNIYLSFSSGIDSENILYSSEIHTHVKNILNSMSIVVNCENVYTSKDCTESSYIFYSKFITNSNNIWFSTNLTGCSECILCDKLENASYCINNIFYEKDIYFMKKQEFLNKKDMFQVHWENLTQIGTNYGSTNVSGNRIIISENIENGNFISRVKNGRNIIKISGVNGCENFYDCIEAGSTSNDLYATCYAGVFASHLYCSIHIFESQHIFYSYMLDTCHHCLFSYGLKNKSYCIFNTQYTKEERYDKVDEIFTQMEQDGDLGKFFPGSMNPFYFNDTAAYLIDDSFTKEEVEAAGYMWRDDQIKVDIPEGVDVISTDDLDQYEGWRDQKRYIDPVILTKVIKDHQGNVYRIVKMEYDFLIKHALPLPRKHWLERIKEHFKIQPVKQPAVSASAPHHDRPS